MAACFADDYVEIDIEPIPGRTDVEMLVLDFVMPGVGGRSVCR